MAIEVLVVSILIVLPLCYVVIKAVQSYKSFRRRAKLINKFPGIEPRSILGHLREFPGPGEVGLRWMHEGNRDFMPRGPSKIWMGFVPAVNVLHPENSKIILKTTEPKPFQFGGYRFAFPWLGDGLLIAKGQKWARNRRLLTPAFHFDILKPYMEINNQRTEILLDKLSACKGEYFEVFSQISLLTLDIILRCAFSYENDCQTRGKQHPYVKAVNELGEAVIHRAIRPWLYSDFIYYNFTPSGWQYKKNCKYVHSVSEDIIEKRKQALEEHGDSILRGHKYIDFLDILLKARDSDGQGLSSLDIRNEVDTFLFEGHDTTSSAISWTLYSLAEHPDIQSKCQAEVDAVLEGRDTDTITWDDLSKLPYLTMCIKEGMRLHSPVPFIERQTTKDMDLDGFLLPEGSLVGINIYVLHHNPTVWEQPYEFRPERFLPENMEKMDPFAFVPFSAGPRNCIGQNFAMHEMKVAIARIMRKFTLEVDPKRKAMHEMALVMRTENGMYLKATPRSL